jgi:hypothetical protein
MSEKFNAHRPHHSSNFTINGGLMKVNLARIDRTTQMFSREEFPTWLATKRRGVTSQVSTFSAPRAQFTFSTQGIAQRIRKLEAAKPALSQHFS